MTSPVSRSALAEIDSGLNERLPGRPAEPAEHAHRSGQQRPAGQRAAPQHREDSHVGQREHTAGHDVAAQPDAVVTDLDKLGVGRSVPGRHRGDPQGVRLAIEHPVPGVEQDPAEPAGGVQRGAQRVVRDPDGMKRHGVRDVERGPLGGAGALVGVPQPGRQDRAPCWCLGPRVRHDVRANDLGCRHGRGGAIDGFGADGNDLGVVLVVMRFG